MTKVLFVLAILATFYFLAHFPAAAWLRHKNPHATVSVGPPAYWAAIILWLATLVSHLLKF